MRVLFLLLCISMVSVQCYYPISYTYTIDLKSKSIEIYYRDLRSDEDVDSAVARDWHDVRNSLECHDSIYTTRYYTVVSRKVFEEDSVLSGKFQYAITPGDGAFSLVNMLRAVSGADDDNTVSWHVTGKEIFLFVDSDADYRLIKSNGKVMETDSTTISVWSGKDSLFTFTFSVDTCCPGTSLLPHFLEDTGRKKSNAAK